MCADAAFTPTCFPPHSSKGQDYFRYLWLDLSRFSLGYLAGSGVFPPCCLGVSGSCTQALLMQQALFECSQSRVAVSSLEWVPG